MEHYIVSLAILKFLLICVIFVNSTTFNAYRSAELQSLFALPKYGWTGGDGDTSFHLYDDIYLWLFQDSLIGCYDQQNKQRCRNDSFVHSTIALQQINPDTHSNFNDPNFVWNITSTGVPNTFFIPSKSYQTQYDFQFWWPQIGISNGSILIIMAAEISNSGSGAMGFIVRGTSVLRVNNIRDDPLNWIYTYKHVDISNPNFTWSSAITWQNDSAYNSVYWIGERTGSNGLHYNLISKGSFEDLANFKFNNFEYYGRNSVNKTGWYYWNDIIALTDVIATGGYGAQSEMTVLYHRGLNMWYTFIIPFSLNQVYLFLSANESIVSEWEYQIIYNIDYPWNQSLYFEYACKAHPELSVNYTKQLVFSWVSNAWNVSDLFVEGGGDIYVPQFIVVDINYS